MHTFSFPVDYLTKSSDISLWKKEKQINLWWYMELTNESNAQPEDVRKKAEQLWVNMSISVKKIGDG